jgi:hypothetical protein
MFVQRPLQQVSPIVQVSPSTRHAARIWHTSTPLLSPRSAQTRPQHSSAFAHDSPAGRQSGTVAHMPPMQTPLQQSGASALGWPTAPQAGPPQAPPVQASEQHVPAAAQLCPSDEQPCGLAQARRPLPDGSGAQT